MPSVETKLAEALTEIKNIRISLTKEVEERQRDHDELVKMKEWARTLFNKVETLEGKDKEVEEELKNLRPLIEKVDNLTEWKDDRDQADNGEVRDAVKETKKRSWQFWLMVLGALVGALATAVIGGLIAKYLFK